VIDKKMETWEYNQFVAEHVMQWEFDANPHGWRLWHPYGRGRGESIGDDHLPDFCHSRDAVAQAEVKIAEMGLCDEYMDELIRAASELEGPQWGNYSLDFKMAHATAKMRCEAMYAIRDHIDRVREHIDEQSVPLSALRMPAPVTLRKGIKEVSKCERCKGSGEIQILAGPRDDGTVQCPVCLGSGQKKIREQV